SSKTSGNYIVALGYRSFSPTFGDIDPTFTYANSMTVSLIPLTDGVGAPADSDWVMPQARQSVTIDFSDAESRLRTLPFLPGRFSALTVADGHVTVIRSTSAESSWEVLELGSDAPKPVWTAKRVQVLDAADGLTLARVDGEKIVMLDASSPGQEESVETKNMTASINLQEEFLQMFDDSWRYQRDFFYDPNMHGLDWPKLRAHYRPMAAAVYTVQELTSVVREMHAELSAGHVYVSVEPPYNRSDAKTTGMLGVDYGVRNGRYFFAKILNPGMRRFEHRSPLDDSVLDVREGDFLLAVNGRELDSTAAPWEAFEGLAGELAELTIARTESGADTRSVVVRLLSSERKLRELDWVEKTRQWVNEASGGKIGYIYVPNTGAEGQNELMQMYRAQYHKEALIIDERFNTGGALGDRFVELLNRPPLNYFSSRNARDYPLPELAHRGPKAMLINSWSYSGGDGFPFLFKEASLGPLIGSQTWGGLIGPGMRMSLVNGGFVSAPPQRVYDTRGNWAEGNEGVRPNIAVRNNPGQLAQGKDQQLQKAVENLLAELKSLRSPRVPAYPDNVSNKKTPSKTE
ncbi:MAG: S41 family peptidase, partial [Pseudomonadota bacterium]